MARTAEAQGIPESAIFIEPEAKDTIQNACYSVRIMKAHGWRSAEVVSSAIHLPRAGIIFNRLPMEWRSHAAPPLEPVSPAKLALRPRLGNIEDSALPGLGDWAERCAISSAGFLRKASLTATSQNGGAGALSALGVVL